MRPYDANNKSKIKGGEQFNLDRKMLAEDAPTHPCAGDFLKPGKMLTPSSSDQILNFLKLRTFGRRLTPSERHLKTHISIEKAYYGQT